MATMTQVRSVNFDELEAEVGQGGVVVDFWAPWCGPCRMLAPMLDQIASDRGDVQFLKIDVDAEPEAAAHYGIRSVPSLLFFKDGNVKNRVAGLVSRDVILQNINAIG